MFKTAAFSLITTLVVVTSQVSSAAAMPSEPIGVGELLKVSAGLLVVVAAIIATAAVLKRLKSMHAAHGNHLQIIDGVSVSTRDRVVLLEVDRQRVLLGVSPGRIETLHVFATGADPQAPFAELVESAQAPKHSGHAL